MSKNVDEFFDLQDVIGNALNSIGGDMDDITGGITSGYDEDRFVISLYSTVERKAARGFKKKFFDTIEKALSSTRFKDVSKDEDHTFAYQLSQNDLSNNIGPRAAKEFKDKFVMFEILITAYADREELNESTNTVKVPAPYNKYFEVSDYQPEPEDYQIGELIDGYNAHLLAYLEVKQEYIEETDIQPVLIDDKDFPVVEIVGGRLIPVNVNAIFVEDDTIDESVEDYIELVDPSLVDKLDFAGAVEMRGNRVYADANTLKQLQDAIDDIAESLNESPRGFYVTTYWPDERWSPEEGGTMSYGWDAHKSKFFRTKQEAQEYLDAVLEECEILSEYEGEYEYKDQDGDLMKIAIEPFHQRGKGHSPARSWVDAEFDVPAERPYFDRKGNRVSRNPRLVAKEKKAAAELEKEFLAGIDSAATKRELIDFISDAKYSALFGKNGELIGNKWKSLKEASYGGAYDVADNQYFTREDLETFADEVIACIAAREDILMDVSELNIDGNIITIGLNNEKRNGEFEHSITFPVDMRKIKLPRDIDKYVQPVAAQFITEYKKQVGEDIDESFKDFLKLFVDTDAEQGHDEDEKSEEAFEICTECGHELLTDEDGYSFCPECDVYY